MLAANMFQTEFTMCPFEWDWRANWAFKSMSKILVVAEGFLGQIFVGLVWVPLLRELSFFLLWSHSLHLLCCHEIFVYLGQFPGFTGKPGSVELVAVREHRQGRGLFPLLTFWVVQCHGKARAIPFSSDQDFSCVNPRTSIGCTTPKSTNANFDRIPSRRTAHRSYSQLSSEIGYKPEPSQLFSWSDKEET